MKKQYFIWFGLFLIATIGFLILAYIQIFMLPSAKIAALPESSRKITYIVTSLTQIVTAIVSGFIPRFVYNTVDSAFVDTKYDVSENTDSDDRKARIKVSIYYYWNCILTITLILIAMMVTHNHVTSNLNLLFYYAGVLLQIGLSFLVYQQSKFKYLVFAVSLGLIASLNPILQWILPKRG